MVTGGQALSWPYLDSDIAAGGPVTRFEASLDQANYADIGMDLVPGSPETYYMPFPAMQTGNHTLDVRPCNAADLCSAPLRFTFTMGVVPVPISGPFVVIDDPSNP